MGANMPAILIHGDAVSGKSHPRHRTSAPLAGTTAVARFAKHDPQRTAISSVIFRLPRPAPSGTQHFADRIPNDLAEFDDQFLLHRRGGHEDDHVPDVAQDDAPTTTGECDLVADSPLGRKRCEGLAILNQFDADHRSFLSNFGDVSVCSSERGK